MYTIIKGWAQEFTVEMDFTKNEARVYPIEGVRMPLSVNKIVSTEIPNELFAFSIESQTVSFDEFMIRATELGSDPEKADKIDFFIKQIDLLLFILKEEIKAEELNGR